MSRKPGKKSASLFFIFTEGDVTERNYFGNTTFGAEPRQDRKCPIINKGHKKGQDPTNMIRWVSDEEKKGGIKRGDSVWILIDKDDNSNVKLRELKKWCDDKGFRLILSNPMFEYWLALHFQYIDCYVDWSLLEKLLSNGLGCRYNKVEDYNKKFHPLVSKAMENAKRARRNIGAEEYCDHNPFTNMDVLIEDICSYLRSGR